MDNPLPLPQALEQARRLEQLPAHVPWHMVLASMPRRAKEALALTLCAAVLVALLFPYAYARYSAGAAVLSGVVLGAALVYAGFRTSGVWRVLRLARQLSKSAGGRVVDVVGFVELSSMSSSRHSLGYATASVRVHDCPDTALAAELERQSMPAWWRANKPESRGVYFDGYAVRRAEGAEISYQVLAEAAVEHSPRSRTLRAGEAVRLLGDESTAVLITSTCLIFPRGRWLAGG